MRRLLQRCPQVAVVPPAPDGFSRERVQAQLAMNERSDLGRLSRCASSRITLGRAKGGQGVWARGSPHYAHGRVGADWWGAQMAKKSVLRGPGAGEVLRSYGRIAALGNPPV